MDTPAESPDKLTVGSALLLVLISVSGAVTVGLVGQMIRRDALIDPIVGVIALIVGPLVALFVALFRYTPEWTAVDAVGLSRRPQVAPLVIAILCGGAAGLPLDELIMQMYAWLPPSFGGETKDLVMPELGIAASVALLIGMVILLPFVHELLYRGFMQPRLEDRIGTWLSIASVALLHSFSLFLNPHMLPTIFLTALLSGVAGAAGGVWAAIACHIASRAAPVLFLIAGGDAPGPGEKGEVVHLAESLTIALSGAALLFTFMLVAFVRANGNHSAHRR